MDKQVYREILNEIKNDYEIGNYDGVIRSAQEIDVEKIRETAILEMIADSYDKLGRYDLAKETLLYAYERTPFGRKMAYNLCLLCIKLDDLDNAVRFYQDFCKMAPRDSDRYILKYLIGKAGGVPVKELIKVLEQYVSENMDEKWQYELARLYHEEGREDDCVRACDDIILWFANGDYVKKALELKFMHRSLTPSQQEKYEEIMREFSDEPARPTREEAEESRKLDTDAEVFASEFLGVEPEIEQPYIEEETFEPDFNIDYDSDYDMDYDGSEIEAQIGRNVTETGRIMAEIAKEQTAEIPVEDNEEVVEETEEFAEEVKRATNDGPAEIDETVFRASDSAELLAALAAIENGDIEDVTEEEEEEFEEEFEDVFGEEAEPDEEPFEEAEEEVEEPEEIVEEISESDKKWVGLYGSTAAKLGIGTALLSSMAGSVVKPSFKTEEPDGKTVISYYAAPRILENVDISNIPLEGEEDGQIGINLDMLSDDKEEIEGQMTIDELFEAYSKIIEDNKEQVAQIEANRLKAIQDEVNRTMVARPLFNIDDNIKLDKRYLDEEDLKALGYDTEEEPEETEEPEEEFAEEAEEFEEELTEEPEEPEEESEEDFDEDFEEEFGEEHEETEEPVEEVEESFEESFEDAEEELVEEVIEDLDEEPIDIEDDFEDLEDYIEELDSVPDEEFIEEPETFDDIIPEEEYIDEPVEEIETEGFDETDIVEEEYIDDADSAIARFEESLGTDTEFSEEAELGLDKLGDTLFGMMGGAAAIEAVTADAAEEPAEVVEEAAEVIEEPEAAESDPVEAAIEAAAARLTGAFTNLGSDEIDDEDELRAELEREGMEEEFDEVIEADFTPVPEPEQAEEPVEEPAEEFEETAEEPEEISEEPADEPEEAPAEDVEESETEEPEVPEEPKLSDELRKELKEHLLVDGMEDNIAQVLDSLISRKNAGDTTGGNLLITGDAKSGKTYLAIALIKEVAKQTGKHDVKLARVDAEKLNNADIGAALKKVGSNNLLVENVGYLNDTTIQKLIDALDQGVETGIIVLEGNQLAMDNIVSNFPEIEKYFVNRINVEELSISQWADLACNYAGGLGYSIDEMALLALHAKIDEMNVPTARFSFDNVKDLIDEAIERAEKRNSGRLFSAFSKKNSNVLTESDFI
ncbi:MAG: hypothetical protein IKR67_04830 [Lachnospiraceae bacterium]|nr:hypothetical protein [Lachnospiraceae bacterium]